MNDLLRPSPAEHNYLLRRLLATQLKRSIRETIPPGARVLDLGCGPKPYRPLFNGVAEYVGVDARQEPQVDVVAPADELPFDAGSFDCVLCTQMLEHVPDPPAVVREIHRVLRPGGSALVSTHGTIRYHPNPEDYYRWTHAGLHQLFTSVGDWQAVTVTANGSLPVAFAYLSTYEAYELARKAKAGWALKPWIFAVNVIAWRADQVWRRLFGHRPPALAANYLVTAIR